MIRAGLLGALAAAVLTGSAPAQEAAPVAVRSGAHDGFDRLVFQFPDVRDWRLGRAGAGYALALDRAADLDLSAVWRRIGRDRLAGLAAAPDGLSVQLDLGCDCHAIAFVHDGAWVVVDIRDGPAPPGSPFEAPLAGVGPAPSPAAAPPPAQGPAPAALPPVIARPRQAAPDGALARAARIADAQAAILEEISRAAGQGLLQSAAPGAGPLPPGPPRPGPPGAGAPGTAPAPDALAARAGVAADTAVDQGQAPRPAGPAPGCPGPDMLNVPDWGDATPPAAQIAALRRRLVGEFDRIDGHAARDLARLYIHLGFGAEAAQTIARLAPRDAQAPVLRSLAAIVDTGAAPPGNPLAPLIECPGPAAMWAVLARDPLAPGAPVRRADLVQAFSALPGHLRRHLGPVLAERLLGHGDAELAAVIRRSTGRAPGDEQPRAALAGARLDLAAGADAAGRAALESVARGNGPDAAEALAMLLEKLADEAGTAPGDLIALAAARAFELRGQPLGERLKAAELRARAANGDPAGALDALAAARRDGTAPADAPVWLARALAVRANDATLAAAYFRHRDTIESAPLPPDTARALARRLAGAGLPGPALALLDAQERRADPEDRLLRAELHLAEGDPPSALAELGRIAGTRTEALRARALALSGNADGALAALAGDGNAGLRADLAWRADDRETVRALGDAAQQAALAAAEPAAPPPAGPPSLADARALIDRGAAAREALRALLDAYPPPDPGPAAPPPGQALGDASPPAH
jgi:hypothetical protein